MSRGSVLCIGETMGMIAPTDLEPFSQASTYRVEAGGAESNVAMRLATHGHVARWRSRLGDDALGHRVAESIAAAGVAVDVEWDSTRPTGLYLKDPGRGVTYYRSGSAASAATPELLDDVDWSGVAIVHMTGITAALSDSCRALTYACLARAHAEGVEVSFDVNHRAPLWEERVAAEVLLDLARAADLVFVGRDEAEKLWDTATADDVRRLLPAARELVVKDGEVGATAWSGDVSAFVATPPVEVVEAVGAGDAFAAGYLSVRLRDGSDVASPDQLAARLAFGHACAAAALSSTADV